MEKIIIADADMLHENFEDILEGKKKGVIKLPFPVGNILEYHSNSSPLCLITGMDSAAVSKVFAGQAWVVMDSDTEDIRKGHLLSEKELEAAVKKYGEGAFTAETGTDAIRKIMSGIDLRKVYSDSREKEQSCMGKIEALREEAGDKGETCTEEELADMQEEFDLLMAELEETRARIDAALYLKMDTNKILISEIRVLPLEIRHLAEEWAKMSVSTVYYDLESAYAAVAGISARLKKLIELKAPEIIIRNEKRMLQESVDTLIANSLRRTPRTKGNYITTFSLADLVMRGTKVV